MHRSTTHVHSRPGNAFRRAKACPGRQRGFSKLKRVPRYIRTNTLSGDMLSILSQFPTWDAEGLEGYGDRVPFFPLLFSNLASRKVPPFSSPPSFPSIIAYSNIE